MRTIARLAALFVALNCGAPAFADAKPAEAAHGAAADAKGDVPVALKSYQRWDLAIYTVIVFLLVLAVLWKFAYPNIIEGLKKREDFIAQAKRDAEAAQQEAKALKLQFERDAAAANDKIRALMEEARRDADALRVKEREAGQKDAAAERDRAKREIEAAKDAALQEIYQKSVELATMISTKAVRRSMNADDHRRLVDESLAEIQSGRM